VARELLFCDNNSAALLIRLSIFNFISMFPASLALLPQYVHDLRRVRHRAHYTEKAFRMHASTTFADAHKKFPLVMSVLLVPKVVSELPGARTRLERIEATLKNVRTVAPWVLIPAIAASSYYFGVATLANAAVTAVSAAGVYFTNESGEALGLVLQSERSDHWAREWYRVVHESEEVRKELRKQYQAGIIQGNMDQLVRRVEDRHHQLKLVSPNTDPESYKLAEAVEDRIFEQQDLKRDNEEFGLKDTEPFA
jgi:hypothetical protein